MQLRRDFSAFLDLVRLVAAVFVFLGHLSDPRFGGEVLRPFLPLAKSSVIAFFVLSGYVISWSAKRDRNAIEFGINRAARIYSVALPALLLTWAVDLAIQAHDPNVLRHQYQLAQPWKYLPLFLTFTTDFWFLDENALSNIPFWSLSYEVWYYVVFGVCFFGRGRWGWLLAAVVLLCIGPRHWLLFPLWLLGVGIQRAHENVQMKRSWARALLAAGLAALVLVKLSGIEQLLNESFNDLLAGFPAARLRYSQNVMGDSLVAASVGMMIFAARDADLAVLGRVQGIIAAFASVSFSLYLDHFPLLLAYGTLLPKHTAAIALLTLATTALAGILFERRKYVLRRLLARIVSTLPIGPKLVRQPN